MATKVKAIPEGYHTVTPYLIVDDAKKAIDFYKRAFGAKDTIRIDGPEGKIMHAEIKIGDSVVMLSDESPEMGAKSAKSFHGSPVTLCLYVENVDELFPQAITAGAKETRSLANQFYGDRSGKLEDPFGHTWVVATHVEDVSADEMKKRMDDQKKAS